MDLYLLRHGAIEGGIPGTFYGATDFPLSEEGKFQALSAGQRMESLHFDGIYVSPLHRATETFRLANETAGWGSELEAIADDRLREMNFGTMERLSFEQIEERDAVLAENIRNDWSSVVFPQGESVEGFRNRISQVLEEIIEKHAQHDRVLIVCHGGVIRYGLCALLDMPYPIFAHLHSEFAHWAMVRVIDGWGVLRQLNA